MQNGKQGEGVYFGDMEQEDRTNLDAFPQAGLGRSSCLVASVNNVKYHYSSIVLSDKFKNLPLKQ